MFTYAITRLYVKILCYHWANGNKHHHQVGSIGKEIKGGNQLEETLHLPYCTEQQEGQNLTLS